MDSSSVFQWTSKSAPTGPISISPKEAVTKAVILLSGGLDSTTLLYEACQEWPGEVAAISFDYGQRHAIELEHAIQIARRKCPHYEVALPNEIFNKGALSGTDPLPLGHYAAPTMVQTIVPNRNAVMLSMAFALGITLGATNIGYAAHAGDHYIYPDCRPIFMSAFDEAMRLANEGGPRLWAPFAFLTKAEIVTKGESLGVPWAETWSCYAGGEVHCGRCGTCTERREAFQLARVSDPTTYAA